MSETSSRSSLLLEIGVEELPSSYVDAALAALPALMAARLGELRLVHGEVKALGTPRRLSVIVKDLASAQMDLDEEVTGAPGERRVQGRQAHQGGRGVRRQAGHDARRAHGGGEAGPPSGRGE